MKFKDLEIGQKFRRVVNGSAGGVELIKTGSNQYTGVTGTGYHIDKNTNVSPESEPPSELRHANPRSAYDLTHEQLADLVNTLCNYLELSIIQVVDGNGEHKNFELRKDR